MEHFKFIYYFILLFLVNYKCIKYEKIYHILLQGTLGLKNEKVIRLLLEMLELDSSDYVRLMVSPKLEDSNDNTVHTLRQK